MLDLDDVTKRVAERWKALDALESSRAVLVEFEVAGNWFGSPWSRERHFRWMIYAALTNAQGQWFDHAEELVRRSRGSSKWQVAQPSSVALRAAEAFVVEHLASGA
ncbi:MAG TPA: hypothetical protein VGE14_13490 [Marmoricola sp.]